MLLQKLSIAIFNASLALLKQSTLMLQKYTKLKIMKKKSDLGKIESVFLNAFRVKNKHKTLRRISYLVN